jgi:stage III sporulation protein AE
MRKISFFLFFFCFASLLSISASAENYEEIERRWEQFVNELPSDVSKLLPEHVTGTDENFYETIRASTYFSTILSQLTVGITEYGKYLTSLLAILVLCAIFEVIKGTLSSGALHNVFGLAGNLSLTVLIATSQLRLIDYTVSYLGNISFVANGIFPVFAAVFAASGNFTFATVHSAGVSLLIVLIERVFCNVLAPILKLCFCFHFLTSLASNRYFDQVHKILKNVYTTLLVSVMTVFGFVMGAKQILAAGADNLIVRGAKHMVSSFVPVVTSMVSGSLNTVATALTLIKNTCGIAGMIIVLALLLPVIISLILNRFVLKVASGLAAMLGEARQEKSLSDTASLNGYLLSLAVCGSVLFIYLLAFIIMTGPALGG